MVQPKSLDMGEHGIVYPRTVVALKVLRNDESEVNVVLFLPDLRSLCYPAGNVVVKLAQSHMRMPEIIKIDTNILCHGYRCYGVNS